MSLCHQKLFLKLKRVLKSLKNSFITNGFQLFCWNDCNFVIHVWKSFLRFVVLITQFIREIPAVEKKLNDSVINFNFSWEDIFYPGLGLLYYVFRVCQRNQTAQERTAAEWVMVSPDQGSRLVVGTRDFIF